MSALEDLYQEVILDHYRAPRHRSATLDPHSVHVHHDNPLCGDELDLRVRVVDGADGSVVDAVVFDGEGCSISMASASTMTEAVTGRTVVDADDLIESFRILLHGEEPPRRADLGDAVAFEGVARFPVRVKCALLGWLALRDALRAHACGDAASTVRHDEDTT